MTCRTLTSVFDHDPSISFCSDQTMAQSWFRVALKILRRNRITFLLMRTPVGEIPPHSDVLGSVHHDGCR
jgi:hypothetical protein